MKSETGFTERHRSLAPLQRIDAFPFPLIDHRKSKLLVSPKFRNHAPVRGFLGRGPGTRFENMSFSNLVMKNGTGPIAINVGQQPRRSPQGAAPTTAAPVQPEARSQDWSR